MKRYAWRDGKLVELDTSYVPQPRIHFITDRAYENLTPVVTSATKDKDGNVEVQRVDISSYAKHRRYMKEHGLALMDDFKETWAAAEKERTALALGQQSDKDIKEELGRQLYRVFDAPGVEERPKFASELADDAVKGSPTEKGYDPRRDTSYPTVTQYIPSPVVKE